MSAGGGTHTLHRCETVPATRETSVLHVVLPPRRPTGTPLTDLRDAGHVVLAVGVLPSEVPECPEAERYPWSEHLLIRGVA